MKKLAVLKDKEDGCPFNLPIPLACQAAGKSIKSMEPHQDNSQIFLWQATGEKCIYNAGIIKDMVNCSYKEEATHSDINSSPLFEKPFSGTAANGLYTVPHVYYSGDTPLKQGPFYDMYGIEMVASERNKK